MKSQKKRGPKSAAELAVAKFAGAGLVQVEERLPPPDELLTAEECAEWKAITSAVAATYFKREHQALLAQLCRHIVCANRISATIHNIEVPGKWDVHKWLKLLAAQRAESQAIAQLCSKLRLAHVSFARQDRSERQADTGPKPWDAIP